MVCCELALLRQKSQVKQPCPSLAPRNLKNAIRPLKKGPSSLRDTLLVWTHYHKARQKNKVVSGPRAHQFQAAHHNFFYFLVTKFFLWFRSARALEHSRIVYLVVTLSKTTETRHRKTQNAERGSFELYIQIAPMVFSHNYLNFLLGSRAGQTIIISKLELCDVCPGWW